MSLGWQIVDRRTGALVSQAMFMTQQQAEQTITAWQDRHDRGGRPDITSDLLLNMQPVEMHA